MELERPRRKATWGILPIEVPAEERFGARPFESHCVELSMRKLTETRPIAPIDRRQTVYLVADDMGQAGKVWRQSECEHSDQEAVIQGMLAGEYRSPIRVVAFNITEHWCEDVSAEVAHEL